MTKFIYIDGVFCEEQDAKISVFDHGLLYGDGVFEGIRFYNGRVFRLDAHLERLEDSARAICLTLPLSRAEMTHALLETIRKNEMRDGYIRLVVTRGIGDLYARGLDVITCATRRVTPSVLSPAVKSLNYLNNIMAKIEANQANAGEGLMLNEQGFVAECTADNIFVIKKGAVLTPPVSAGALGGITRGVVLELAAELGVPVSEPDLTRYDIYTADECFLTGTGAEVIPVVRLDSREIGAGKPGPITAKFIARFHELTQKSGTAIYT